MQQTLSGENFYLHQPKAHAHEKDFTIHFDGIMLFFWFRTEEIEP